MGVKGVRVMGSGVRGGGVKGVGVVGSEGRDGGVRWVRGWWGSRRYRWQ